MQIFTPDSQLKPVVPVAGGGSVPVGLVMAWHKNLPGVPALPAEWVECNGQVVSDPASPLNGQTLPNLNSGNRFLRGNTVSGGMGGEAVTYLNSTDFYFYYSTFGTDGNGQYAYTGIDSINSKSNEPPYMDVVWVMRIK